MNKIKCKLCGDIIESKHRHDFVTCKCGKISVDGGNSYQRRVGYPENWQEYCTTTGKFVDCHTEKSKKNT